MVVVSYLISSGNGQTLVAS